MRPSPRQYAWLALVTAVLVTAYSYAGYAMVASLSVSNPERLANYRIAAWIYLGSMAAGLLTAIGAAIYLFRSRGRALAAGDRSAGR